MVGIKPGKYLHYKGGPYQVLGEGRHTEEEQRFAVYKPLYFNGGDSYEGNLYQLRPKEMFLEDVETGDGEKVKRFKKIEDEGFFEKVVSLAEKLRGVMEEGKVNREQFYIFCLMFTQDFDFKKAALRTGLKNEKEDFYKKLAKELDL